MSGLRPNGPETSTTQWILSRRDGAIVAWHEVPGWAPAREPSRRVRSDSGRRAHGLVGSDEIAFAAASFVVAFRRLATLDHTVPYGTVRSVTASQALRARLRSH
jgi:hypothetical protein